MIRFLNFLQVMRGWNATASIYPRATLLASSMDDFTRNLLARKDLTDNLPVVTAELGDTYVVYE
jgi:hypothetical protein